MIYKIPYLLIFIDYSRGTAAFFAARAAKMYTSVLGGEWMLSNISLYLLARLMGWEEEGKANCTSNATQAEQRFWNYDPLGEKTGAFDQDISCKIRGKQRFYNSHLLGKKTAPLNEEISCKMVAFVTQASGGSTTMTP